MNTELRNIYFNMQKIKLYNCILDFFFYNIAEVYVSFFIKCTVQLYNFIF